MYLSVFPIVGPISLIVHCRRRVACVGGALSRFLRAPIVNICMSIAYCSYKYGRYSNIRMHMHV